MGPNTRMDWRGVDVPRIDSHPQGLTSVSSGERATRWQLTSNRAVLLALPGTLGLEDHCPRDGSPGCSHAPTPSAGCQPEPQGHPKAQDLRDFPSPRVTRASWQPLGTEPQDDGREGQPGMFRRDAGALYL